MDRSTRVSQSRKSELLAVSITSVQGVPDYLWAPPMEGHGEGASAGSESFFSCLSIAEEQEVLFILVRRMIYLMRVVGRTTRQQMRPRDRAREYVCTVTSG